MTCETEVLTSKAMRLLNELHTGAHRKTFTVTICHRVVSKGLRRAEPRVEVIAEQYQAGAAVECTGCARILLPDDDLWCEAILKGKLDGPVH
jgi:hypothetical protein